MFSRKRQFRLGQTVATTGAMAALREAEQDAGVFLARHQAGDWGEVSPEDATENELSVRDGYRVMSAYTLRTGVKIWIITEADRSATTVLLPSEY